MQFARRKSGRLTSPLINFLIFGILPDSIGIQSNLKTRESRLKASQRCIRWLAFPLKDKGMNNIDKLVKQLQDRNPDVHRGAVEALAKAGEPGAVAPLITALQDESESVRGRALQGLKDIGSPAVPLLIIVLKNPDPRLRRKASCVIDNIGYELKDIRDLRAVEPLIAALKDPTSVVRSHSVAALGKIGGPQVLPAVISALKTEAVRSILDIGVCYRAIEATHRLGETTAEFLIPALKHPDAAIRRKAATLLGKTGEAGAVDLLIGALKDEHPRVRSRAAHALGRIGNPGAVESLTVALKDAAPNVRINALHALGKFGESAAAALTLLLADPAASVRRHAAAALEKTGNKRAITQLEKMATDEPEGSVRQAAKRALKKRRG